MKCQKCKTELPKKYQGNICGKCVIKQGIRIVKDCKDAMLKNGLKNMTEKQALERFSDNINTVAWMGHIDSKQIDKLASFIKKECKK